MVTPFFAAACNGGYFFFFPHWWKYLPAKDIAPDCSINFPPGAFPGDLWLIGLAIIDILLSVAGLVAIISIIIAGVTYITSGGNSENTAKARRRIINSLLGLVIVFVAAGVVAFLGNTLGGS